MSLSCDSCGFQGPQNHVTCLYIGAGAAARSEDKGGFWNGSDVDAHAVNTWKSVVAFGYVWIRILSVFFFALKRLEYQDLDHMMPSLGLMPRGKGPGDPSEPPTTGFTGHMVELDHFCQIP